MRDVLYEHELHNRLFPTTPYSLIGVTDVDGDVRLVYTQPYLQDGYRAATQEEIDGYLTGVLGLKKGECVCLWE